MNTEEEVIPQPTDFPVVEEKQHPACQLIDCPKLAHLGATQVGRVVGMRPFPREDILFKHDECHQYT